jgi:hypothetical protein
LLMLIESIDDFLKLENTRPLYPFFKVLRSGIFRGLTPNQFRKDFNFFNYFDYWEIHWYEEISDYRTHTTAFSDKQEFHLLFTLKSEFEKRKNELNLEYKIISLLGVDILQITANTVNNEDLNKPVENVWIYLLEEDNFDFFKLVPKSVSTPILDVIDINKVSKPTNLPKVLFLSKYSKYSSQTKNTDSIVSLSVFGKAENCVLDGNLYCGYHSSIRDCNVGKNVLCENYSTIAYDNFTGDNCVIGELAMVKGNLANNCIIGNNVKIPKYVYVPAYQKIDNKPPLFLFNLFNFDYQSI